MRVLVIDAQGGGLGRQIVSAIKDSIMGADITAVGTNSVATAAMLKAGAKYAATGENAVRVACKTADVIVGPIGIVIADSMMGEITAQMAVDIAQSRAKKVLLPLSSCGNLVVGVREYNIGKLIQEAVEEIKKIFLSL